MCLHNERGQQTTYGNIIALFFNSSHLSLTLCFNVCVMNEKQGVRTHPLVAKHSQTTTRCLLMLEKNSSSWRCYPGNIIITVKIKAVSDLLNLQGPGEHQWRRHKWCLQGSSVITKIKDSRQSRKRVIDRVQ